MREVEGGRDSVEMRGRTRREEERGDVVRG